VFDVAQAGVERIDFGPVNVNAQDLGAGTGKLEAQRKPDVTEADNGDCFADHGKGNIFDAEC
jgi:hypothetical protein